MRIEDSINGEPAKITLDDERSLQDSIEEKLGISSKSIFPSISINQNSIGQENWISFTKLGDYLVTQIQNLLSGQISSNIINQVLISKEAHRIIENPILSPEQINSYTQLSCESEFHEFYKDLANIQNGVLRKLVNICQLYVLSETYEKLCQVWENLILNSTYIGPCRAKIRRYNIIDSLDTSEIFFDGRNVPSFLSKLDSDQLENFSNWVRELFGFGISTETTNGHICILKLEGGITTNLVDSGHGVLQILPILAQIWWDSKNFSEVTIRSRANFGYDSNIEFSSKLKTKIIAIEQPELHLHNVHQACLANTFVKALSDSRNNEAGIQPIFLVETQSEAFISRLGNLIKRCQISPDDVQVLIFSKDIGNSSEVSEIYTSYFHEKGNLVDWPYGIFGY